MRDFSLSYVYVLPLSTYMKDRTCTKKTHMKALVHVFICAHTYRRLKSPIMNYRHPPRDLQIYTLLVIQ